MKSLERRPIWGSIAAVAIALTLVLLAQRPTTFAQSAADRWVGTWGTAEVARAQNPNPPNTNPPLAPFMQNNRCPAPPAPPAAQAPAQPPQPAPFQHFNNQTLRQVVHTSIGGSKARVVLANTYGTAPIEIGAANIALRDKDGAIQTASSRPLTFSGRPSMIIPPGAVLYSDPVNMTVPQLTDLAIDIFLPGNTNTPSPLTVHTGALQTNYFSETGNHVGKATLPGERRISNWFLLSRVDVVAPDALGTIVTFGDSITDGSRSTPDTNNRWPNHLARRLLTQSPPIKMGVVNMGIGGNRVLGDGTFTPPTNPNAMSRFERHALTVPGVTHIIVLEGINDIGGARLNPSPTAEDMIAGHRQLIARAHAAGIKIIGATLTPYWGAGYYTEVGETKRKAQNEWIRTSKEYDGVADFDKATQDPADPKKFLEKYDSCDYLHPGDAGYKAMADSIDLSLFRPAQTRTTSSSN
jgi:lysophospholipase L1-like esterase